MRHMVIATCSTVLMLTGCFGKPLERFKDKAKTGATATDGVAAISGVNGGSVTGAGAVAGASAEFAPGTLAVDTNVTIEEGLPLDTDATAAELGVAEGFGTAGAAVAVSSSTPTDGVSPFTISLPMPAPAAALQGDPYELVVILFKYFIAAENRYEIGVWAKDKFTIDGTTAKVPTLYFGVYQAVFAKSLIATSIKIASATPIVTKAQDAAAAPVTWSAVEIVSSVGLKAKMRATVTGLPGLAACVMVADRDKVEPWDVVSPKLTVSEYEFTAPEAGTYAARFECTGTDGRLSPVSDWSASISLSGVAPPVIISVSPTSVVADGGSLLTVSGSGFKAGATVKLGTAVCASATVVSATKITCTAPTLVVGKYDVIVTSNGDTVTKKDGVSAKTRGHLVLFSGDEALGTVVQTGTTAQETFVFKNTGGLPITVTSTTITGAGFTVVDNCNGATVAVNATCSVGMTLMTTTLGVKTASIDVDYFDGFGNNAVTPLALTGGVVTPALLSFDLGSAYDFGTIVNGVFRATLVTATNSGGAPATGLSFFGLSAPFTRPTGGTCAATLNPGDACTFYVKYSGENNDNAAMTQTLSLFYDNGLVSTSATLSLTGKSSSLVEVTSLMVNAFQTCVRLTSDVVKCWGKNDSGQLGQDSTSNVGGSGSVVSGVNAVTPLPVKAKRVFGAGDASHACIISDTNQLYCWGPGLDGRTGHGDALTWGNNSGGRVMANLPVTDLGTGYWVKDVALGGNFTCAILGHLDGAKDGRVKCFGGNNYGQLGLGDIVSRGGSANQMGDFLPEIDFAGTVETAVALKAGASHACAILTDGNMQCWGKNDFGQLGLESPTAAFSSPTAAVDLGAGRTAVKIALGTQHTCALLDDDTLKCWGDNGFGQLGTGAAGGIIGDDPTEISGLSAMSFASSTPSDVVAGRHTTCAFMANGASHCWGNNDQGQFGYDSTASNYPDSATAPGIATVIVSSAEGYASPLQLAVGDHVCVKLGDSGRSLRCLGANTYGEAGLGSASAQIHGGTITVSSTATLVQFQ